MLRARNFKINEAKRFYTEKKYTGVYNLDHARSIRTAINAICNYPEVRKYMNGVDLKIVLDNNKTFEAFATVNNEDNSSLYKFEEVPIQTVESKAELFKMIIEEALDYTGFSEEAAQNIINSIYIKDNTITLKIPYQTSDNIELDFEEENEEEFYHDWDSHDWSVINNKIERMNKKRLRKNESYSRNRLSSSGEFIRNFYKLYDGLNYNTYNKIKNVNVAFNKYESNNGLKNVINLICDSLNGDEKFIIEQLIINSLRKVGVNNGYDKKMKSYNIKGKTLYEIVI